MTSWRRTVRRDAHELAALDGLLLALDDQRQGPLEDEVDLLLALVAMDAPALARLEHDLVDPEARHPELRGAATRSARSASGSSAVRAMPLLHDRRSYGGHGRARSRAR